MNSVFVNRIIRACKLDVSLYEEVEADSSAILQALLIVILVSIVRGISTLTEADNALSGIGIGVVGGLVSWSVWAFITYIIGVKLLRTEATNSSWGELARVTGFALTPGLLFILVLVIVWIVQTVRAFQSGLTNKGTGMLIGIIPAFIISVIATFILALIIFGF